MEDEGKTDDEIYAEQRQYFLDDDTMKDVVDYKKRRSDEIRRLRDKFQNKKVHRSDAALPVIEITKKGIKEMTTDKALDKSVRMGCSVGEHEEAVNRVDELLRDGVVTETRAGGQGRHAGNDKVETVSTLKSSYESQVSGDRCEAVFSVHETPDTPPYAYFIVYKKGTTQAMSSRGSALMGRTWVVPDVGIRPYIEAKVNTKTMIKLKIESKLLRALPAGLREAELGSVRKSAGGHVRKAVQKNFLELAGKTGSRKWWGKAARQTMLVQREEDGLAVVEVRQVGVRLHWKGGTVRTPEEVHVITSRNGCPLLLHGKRLKTRTNLTWLGKLVPQAALFF